MKLSSQHWITTPIFLHGFWPLDDAQIKVQRVEFSESDFTLDLEDLASKLGERTRLVAVGCASNATGGINPVKRIAEMAHKVGALVYLDAVHYGPHGLIDVADWNCDFLACSAYKFFGPHIGILWGRQEHLESLEAYQVRPAGDQIPGKWMTGTQSFESIAGGLACVDYLTDLGRDLADDATLNRRDALAAAFSGISSYEQELSRHLILGFREIDGIKIWGIDDAEKTGRAFFQRFRSLIPKVKTPRLAEELSQRGIYVWHGNYYALEFTEHLGLEPEGMVRIGLAHYNTIAEIDRLMMAIESIVANG